MSILRAIRKFARCNVWATEKLLEYLKEIPDAAYYAHQGMCFRSIHGTLNHLVLTDRLWCHRLFGDDAGTAESYWSMPVLFARPNDASIYWEEYIKDREEMSQALLESTRRILDLVESIPDDADLDAKINYERKGDMVSKHFATCLLHMINHGTHHRGQITAVLPQYGIVPALDYIIYEWKTPVEDEIAFNRLENLRLFNMIHRYAESNVWATDELLKDLGPLPDKDYHAHQGLCFRSIHGTLNHLIVATKYWLAILTKKESDLKDIGSYFSKGSTYSKIGDEKVYWEDIYLTREATAKEFKKVSQELVDYLDSLDPDTNLDGMLNGRTHLATALIHIINHATHHRGQITAVTVKYGIIPSLDLFYYANGLSPEKMTIQ